MLPGCVCCSTAGLLESPGAALSSWVGPRPQRSLPTRVHLPAGCSLHLLASPGTWLCTPTPSYREGKGGHRGQLGGPHAPPTPMPSSCLHPRDRQPLAKSAVMAPAHATSSVPGCTGCQHWAGPGGVAPPGGFAPHWAPGQWQGCPGSLPSGLPGAAPWAGQHPGNRAGPAPAPCHHLQGLDWAPGPAAAPGARGSPRPRLQERRGSAQGKPAAETPPGAWLPYLHLWEALCCTLYPSTPAHSWPWCCSSPGHAPRWAFATSIHRDSPWTLGFWESPACRLRSSCISAGTCSCSTTLSRLWAWAEQGMRTGPAPFWSLTGSPCPIPATCPGTCHRLWPLPMPPRSLPACCWGWTSHPLQSGHCRTLAGGQVSPHATASNRQGG